MHALELAKTAWNAVVTYEQTHAPHAAQIREYEDLSRHYLSIAACILELIGPEGDEGGPLEELQVIRSLLQP